MVVANSLVYNNIVYGNELGRMMGPVDNLFFLDYAVESRGENLKAWFVGCCNKIATTVRHMTPLQSTCTIGNIMAYEMIKAKCRVEEASRKHSQVNHKMAVWNDLRSMLHFRICDAAFLKIVPFGSLTDDELDVIGFATVLHDMVDFGYDLSVKESSNCFMTMVGGKLDDATVREGYVRMANGLQYILETCRSNANGLTFLATHYWQLSNGRHRIVPSIYNGATAYEHKYLQLPGSLLDVLTDKNPVYKNVISKEQFLANLRATASKVGPDAVEMTRLVTVEMEANYLGTDELNTDVMERKMMELSLSLAIGCDAEGNMVEFLWMICEYMWLRTGMMLSCLMGSLKIMYNRRQSDDRGGLQYKW